MPASVLDGAAGTYLESLGAPLHKSLWSSGALLTEKGQNLLRQMHRAYIEAGADVITSTTYQASVTALMDTGLSENKSLELMTQGVLLAKEEARSASSFNRHIQVAAGLGPYGAYLSHGEEYTGDYGDVTDEQLRQFWVPRVQAVLRAQPDVLLFETVPNLRELRIILKDLVPLARVTKTPVWISLSLRIPEISATGSEIALADGTLVSQLAEIITLGAVETEELVIGANCFDVSRTSAVLTALKTLGLPMLVYPNSGETYDGSAKTWSNTFHDPGLKDWDPKTWEAQGAVAIGGCCRTSPDIIAHIKRELA